MSRSRHAASAIGLTALLALAAGCGGGSPHPASSERAEASPPQSSGAYDQAHRDEAVQLAAKTAGKAAPGRLDLERVDAEYTCLSLPPAPGARESTMAWCWQVTFAYKPERVAGNPPPAAVPEQTSQPSATLDGKPLPDPTQSAAPVDPEAAVERTDVAPPAAGGSLPTIVEAERRAPPAPQGATGYVVCVLADGTVRDVGAVR